jgi:jumonji domain-containing protein 7
MQDPVAGLITTYHELNATVIDELHEEPSALEFMRYVAKNRPFVVRGGAKSWKACESWDAAYLSDVMRSEDVQVAVTPYGYVGSRNPRHELPFATRGFPVLVSSQFSVHIRPLAYS